MAPSSWRQYFLGLAKQPHPNHPHPLQAALRNAGLRTQHRFWDLQHFYLPSLKQRAQSRIWHFILAKRFRKRQPAASAVFAKLRGRGFAFPRPRLSKDGAPARRPGRMAYSGSDSGLAYGRGSNYGGAESHDAVGQGSRRRKFAGYLKAANEMRQIYFSGDSTGRSGSHDDKDGGGFPEAAVVRDGNEELILFPSYARKHTKTQVFQDTGNPRSEQEYWQQQWDKRRDVNAVVDVDVRGWVYVPHRGPHTRKQRLAIGALRQFAGVPAPPSTKQSDSRYSSGPSSRSSSPERLSKQEEDLIQLETEKIVRRGELERRNAQRGVYSERPSKASDADSVYGPQSRSSSPDLRGVGNRASGASSVASPPGSPTVEPVKKRESWAQPSRMSPAELAVANAHLLHRARPFMHNGIQNSPIKLFFYNDEDSREQIVYTDPSGHFTCRAALEFVPTHVRILATDRLSTTEEVHVIPPKGVSLISDIDDTVKHSAISMGVTEVVRNAFIRELGDLTIEGVREWYNTLHDMGVKMHYVSNSPWQLYPILTSFFKLAHLPKGTFHLKQYSGLLAGIFEPVAERKKSSIDKILRDFPDRKFIMVGDSGEADLEVYTDSAIENPGRVIGIFIRDVTTPARTGYFDMSGPPAGGKQSRNHSRNRSGDTLGQSKRLSRPDDIRNDDAELQAAIAASLADMEKEARQARRTINPDAPALERFDGALDRKPKPPPPRRSERIQPLTQMPKSAHENLIDLSEPAPSKPWIETHRNTSSPAPFGNGSKPTPSPPPKPPALRSPSPNPHTSPAPDKNAAKAPPPRPRKPSAAVKPSSLLLSQADGPTPPVPHKPPSPSPPNLQTYTPSPLSQATGQESPTMTKSKPPLPSRGKLTERIATAAGNYWYGNDSSQSAASHSETPRSSSGGPGESRFRDPDPTPRAGPPPLPARRGINATPSSMHGYSTSSRSSNRQSGNFDDSGDMPGSLPSTPGETGMSKKEYLWQQRLAKARRELEPRGVTLRTWRVGSDVADVAVKLAEMEFRRIKKEEG